MAKKYANAYRVVSRDTVSAYETGDFSAVPNLDGAYMKETFESMNKNQYLDDVRYLHFFKHMGDARNYLEEMQDVVPGVDFCVLEFNFDAEAMLRQLAGTGFYHSKAYNKLVSIPEYIVPVEVYNAKENLGEVAPSELEHSFGTFVEDTYY